VPGATKDEHEDESARASPTTYAGDARFGRGFTLSARPGSISSFTIIARGWGEYLVNIAQGRRTAQERVTGGRWRGIVLGDVLAEHVVELRGRARVWPWR
jgi:hypothetical protein